MQTSNRRLNVPGQLTDPQAHFTAIPIQIETYPTNKSMTCFHGTGMILVDGLYRTDTSGLRSKRKKVLEHHAADRFKLLTCSSWSFYLGTFNAVFRQTFVMEIGKLGCQKVIHQQLNEEIFRHLGVQHDLVGRTIEPYPTF